MSRADPDVEVPPVRLRELQLGTAEASPEVAARVAQARLTQRERFAAEHPQPANAALDERGRALAEAAFERLGLSARALHRVLKVARTIADLAEAAAIDASHVAEAIQYRALDRRLAA